LKRGLWFDPFRGEERELMSQTSALVSETRRRAADAAFGQPLVQNNFRATVVEAIVEQALPQAWSWCSADWAGWDFEHRDGARLEVKQSAAKQTWAAPAKPSPARFDIAQRRGRWEGALWIPEAGRHAHLYVFAYHPVTDHTADHRDPLQWRFYVAPTAELPATRSISLKALQGLTSACGFGELGERVEALRLAQGG
jgi:hypothetical protein